MSRKKETMTSPTAPIILIVLLTVVRSGAGNAIDVALSPIAIHTSGSAVANPSQVRATVDQQVDRMKRSSEFKESAVVGPDRFASLADDRLSQDSSNWNDEVDENGGQFPVKRGRWSKNNVQMWGKRSFHLSGQKMSASGSPWSSSDGDVANVGLRIRSPPAPSYGGGGDGTWSKRKKTWEKNNFKMWGKRSVRDLDDKSDAVDRYLPLIARVLEERRLSRSDYGDGDSDDVIDDLGETRDGRVTGVELELPSSYLSSNFDGGRERPLSDAVDLRELVQRPKKKVGWSNNNVQMWG